MVTEQLAIEVMASRQCIDAWEHTFGERSLWFGKQKHGSSRSMIRKSTKRTPDRAARTTPPSESARTEDTDRPAFYEFFAGAGMARAGLGPGWRCLFANDIDPRKARSYRRNWKPSGFVPGDIRNLATADLPGHAELAWASFPCQDLSHAGLRAGLDGERSGTFWAFWNLVANLRQEQRAPRTIVLENVEGTLTSHGGEDFLAICRAFADGGYRFGAVVVDAADFVPQSRPRLFIIAADARTAPPERLTTPGPDPRIHTTRLRAAHGMLPRELAAKWIWWALPEPPPRRTGLIDVLERDEDVVDWDPPEKTRAILAKMNDRHQERVRAAQDTGRPMAGTVYQRTRRDRDGLKVQRCEVRFDGVAGCLRTPAGGSSLQIVLKANRKNVRTRRMTSRESARLMGLPDGYILPEGYYDAYHLTGDGVAVPVVTFLAEHILEPLASGTSEQQTADGPPETRRPRPRQAQLDLHGA